MREFEPGVLPPTLDLGDKFIWEDKTYKVKGASGSGWIWAQHVTSPALTAPEEFSDGRSPSSLLAEPAQKEAAEPIATPQPEAGR